MALPTLGAIAVEWVVLTRFFGAELSRPRERVAVSDQANLPRFALTVLGIALGGFLLSSVIGNDLLWIAAAGAGAPPGPALVRRTRTRRPFLRALPAGFLSFVPGPGATVSLAAVNRRSTALPA